MSSFFAFLNFFFGRLSPRGAWPWKSGFAEMICARYSHSGLLSLEILRKRVCMGRKG
jgi:hypothetical protein